MAAAPLEIGVVEIPKMERVLGDACLHRHPL